MEIINVSYKEHEIDRRFNTQKINTPKYVVIDIDNGKWANAQLKYQGVFYVVRWCSLIRRHQARSPGHGRRSPHRGEEVGWST